MDESKINKNRHSFCKKVIGISIIAVVAVYCMPELQEKIRLCTENLKKEWRKIK